MCAPLGGDSKKICSPPIPAASCRRGPGPSRCRSHTCGSTCLLVARPLHTVKHRMSTRHHTTTNNLCIEGNIPAPSWFLHWRGTGESRPELSGETERRPGSSAMAKQELSRYVVVVPDHCRCEFQASLCRKVVAKEDLEPAWLLNMECRSRLIDGHGSVQWTASSRLQGPPPDACRVSEPTGGSAI